jgi:hypothetical protein
VALLLIAAMATDNLSDVELRVREIANTKADKGTCGLTGKRLFQNALAATLGSEELANRVTEISISRTSPLAMIRYQWTKGKRTTFAWKFSTSTSSEPVQKVMASVDGCIIQTIAGDIARDFQDTPVFSTTKKQVA